MQGPDFRAMGGTVTIDAVTDGEGEFGEPQRIIEATVQATFRSLGPLDAPPVAGEPDITVNATMIVRL